VFFSLFPPRISPFCPFSSEAERDYPEILPTRKWGIAQDIPGAASNVLPTRGVQDE